MSSSLVAAFVGLGGVIIGGVMTMVTTWWQALNARNTRIAELDIQLRNERFLRDEAVRRSAMLELVYAFRRFNQATYDAQRNHNHSKKLATELDSPYMQTLVHFAQMSMDLLDKDASLIDSDTRETLEVARDMWESVYSHHENLPTTYRDDNVDEDCCPLGNDLYIIEMEATRAVRALEKHLDAMRFT